MNYYVDTQPKHLPKVTDPAPWAPCVVSVRRFAPSNWEVWINGNLFSGEYTKNQAVLLARKEARDRRPSILVGTSPRPIEYRLEDHI